MIISCPHCNSSVGAPDDIVPGITITCCHCGNLFPTPDVIPASNSEGYKHWLDRDYKSINKSRAIFSNDDNSSTDDYLSGIIGFSYLLLILAIVGLACCFVGLFLLVITRDSTYLAWVCAGFGGGIIHLFMYFILRALYHIGTR